MSNPGHDIFNMRADDVLAPKRQAEIAQVIAALKNFHPTKVAVEGDVGDDRIPKRYADYLAGKHNITRNDGAGHLGWLQHDFASNPKLRLRELAQFAK